MNLSPSADEIKRDDKPNGKPESKSESKPENNWLSLIFNVLIPVLILHKLSVPLGPIQALLLALSFPLSYGIFDFTRRKRLNPLSLLGFLNVTVTGGLAVLGLGGIWFSLKEAFFPLLIGVFVFSSAFGKTPLIKSVFLSPHLMNLDRIQALLRERDKEEAFDKHIQMSTVLLSGSFFLSAVLNFFLSLRIFTELDPALSDTDKALMLNSQIATMTQWSFLVILLPSFICLALVLWHLLSGIKDLTGLQTDEIMKS